jgi:predicted nucleotidyltransferase
MTPILEKKIDHLVDQIVASIHPLRIILFGSAARGEMGPNSDIDLLVVVEDGADTGVITNTLYSQVRGGKIGFDIIVATTQVLEK